MGILIADGGSTKVAWSYLASEHAEPAYEKSRGLNPFYHTIESLKQSLNDEVVPTATELDWKIHAVAFYGAGCAGEEACGKMAEALSAVFEVEKSEILVDSDILGAARAVCGTREGVACILGTGHNSCHYDGEKIIDQVPVLGFTLGDEASAGYFGRKVIQSYFYREMPEELKSKYEKEYETDRPSILKEVYQKDHPNRYVAGFAKFAGDNKEHPFIRKMLHDGFSEFLNRHVCKYHLKEDTPIGFIGSVAFHNREIVEEALEEQQLKAGAFLTDPVEGLISYHRQTWDSDL